MQSFGNGDRLDKRKARITEGRTETRIRLPVRLMMNSRVLASRAQRSIVEFSHGGARDKREGQQEDPDERVFPPHRTNWTACQVHEMSVGFE
jgi:hypothetical protein